MLTYENLILAQLFVSDGEKENEPSLDSMNEFDDDDLSLTLVATTNHMQQEQQIQLSIHSSTNDKGNGIGNINLMANLCLV